MTEKRPNINWMDILWLLFLVALALIPPVKEWHKQALLLAFGVTQLAVGWVVVRLTRRGPTYIVLIKIGLATLFINLKGELCINSSYWQIIFITVVNADE